MPWESERNLRSLSPHGLKEMQGHAAHVDVSAGTEMPPGILGTSLNRNHPDQHRHMGEHHRKQTESGHSRG